MEVHHHPQLHHKPKPWKEYHMNISKKTINTILRLFIYIIIGFTAAYFYKKLKN